MKTIKLYQSVGDVVHAHGDGWEYKQVGDLREFTQIGKVCSLRQIKTLLKMLGKL